VVDSRLRISPQAKVFAGGGVLVVAAEAPQSAAEDSIGCCGWLS